jgi:cytochrome c oxidase assembly protein subunit 15
VLGVAVVAVYVLLRRRGARDDVQRPVAFTAVLLAVQGAVGGIQYALEAPAEIVWVHVMLAALTWISLLWATAAAGRPAPASMTLPAASEEAAEPPAADVRAVLGGSGRVAR